MATRGACTLSYADFATHLRLAVGRFSDGWLNPQQEEAVQWPPAPPLFIVAGPGTGKTTVLSLRVLKLIFVDGFMPDAIMATTFTRKAAKELRSKILGWGAALHSTLLASAVDAADQERIDWLEGLDVSAILTGTLDSLSEEAISDDRLAGEISPAVVDQFTASGLFRRHVIFPGGWHRDRLLEDHLKRLAPGFSPAGNFARTQRLLQEVSDRFIQDEVAVDAYAQSGPGPDKLASVIRDYWTYLNDNHLLDFAALEHELLLRLRGGRLERLTSALRVLLVDEFQDTNYLQEQIYYELCRRSGCGLTVVGDDDQSIFRFRGATVEIFADLPRRMSSALGLLWNPHRIDLVTNYRSSRPIVDLFNHFGASEADFQSARASGKQACQPASARAGFPVLGMFRASAEELAHDVADVLLAIFRGNGYRIRTSGGEQLEILRGDGGDFGDGVLLGASVAERGDKPRLPILLRRQLESESVPVYNPRGRELGEIPEVSRLLGLMLECIDPEARLQQAITTLRPSTAATLTEWRAAAEEVIRANPVPRDLRRFVHDWQHRSPGSWPSEWPLLELMFTLVAWFPSLQHNPEGQVYLEAIARAISQTGQISPFECLIQTRGDQWDEASVHAVLRAVFESVADGTVQVDEDIMPYVPRSYFPIMTIHQAKGLEFPLVIVDVGSGFRTNHWTQRRSRYPEDGDRVHRLEDHLASYTPVGPARTARTGQQRAFDDLRRLYYVAKSRPQQVLLLVGLTTQLSPPGATPRVRSVATGDLSPLDASGGRSYIFEHAVTWSPQSPPNMIALI